MPTTLADTQVETSSLVFTTTLIRNNEQTSRTLTIEIYHDTPAKIKSDGGAFRNLLLGKFNKLLQPTGWRDSDITEDVWTTNAVTVKFINKAETKFDYT